MRKYLASLAFALVFATLVSGSAQALDWSGSQVLTTVSGEKQIGTSEFNLYGFLLDIRAPSAGWVNDFLYAGASYAHKFEAVEVWAAVLAVDAINYFPGHDAFGPSGWVALNTDRFGFFAEGDGYFGSQSRRGYYGLYAADFKPNSYVKLGAQAEQIDWAMKYGPHACFDKGMYAFCFNYFVQPKDSTHFFRIHTALRF